MKLPRTLKKLILIVSSLLIVIVLAVYALTFHPRRVQAETVYNAVDAPMLEPGQEIKVMTWNVQYMAGKKYTFFYDTVNSDGPDLMPGPDEVVKSFKGVARIIEHENPDIILLQEVDDGAKRTYYEDQLQTLLNLLPDHYKSYTSSYYWKNRFMPMKKIWGSTGMKLAIISKYRITESTRHQLSLIPKQPLEKAFNFKRAVMKAKLPVRGGKDFFALNTHLSAFSQGTDNMTKQVKEVLVILDNIERTDGSWVLGGDFNLMLPGEYEKSSEICKCYYQSETEMSYIMEKYPLLPDLYDLRSLNRENFFTHFSNDPSIEAPDRTIDYLVYSPKLGKYHRHYVRQRDAMEVSDHFPVVSTFKIPD